MKRIVFLILFLFLFGFKSFTQGGGFEIQSGTGTYSMSGLKALNRILKIEIPFDTKIVTNFPPYFNYSAFAKIRIKDAYLGAVYSFQTTGSRLSGRDYSGEYYFDLIVKGNSPGIFCEYFFSPDSKFEYSFRTTLGLVFTRLKMHEYFFLLEQQLLDDNNYYKSRNLYFEPDFNIYYPVGSFKLGISAGYLFQYGDDSFKSIDNPEIKLANPYSGATIKPGWNGLRAGISLGWYFDKKADQ